MTPSQGELAWADAWLAAVLLALDPQGLGGVRLRGPADPRRERWLLLLRQALPTGAAWVRMPLHTDDDRLLGGLDLGETLKRGHVVAQPGLLARSDGGVLVTAMAERMSAATAARLTAAMDTRAVAPHRQGLHTETPARLAVVALDEGLDADESPPTALLERLGLQVDLNPLPWPMDSAAQSPAASLKPETRLPERDAYLDTQALAEARQRLPAVRCDEAFIQVLCETADALGVASLRAVMFAVSAARAHAAWSGRDSVCADDAAAAARLVLVPRATRLPAPPAPNDSDEQTPDHPAPQPPDETDEAPPDTSPPPPGSAAGTSAPEPGAPDPQDEQASPGDDPQLREQVLQATLAAMPPGLLAMLAAAAGRGPSAGGRAGALRASLLRGRPYGSRRGDPRNGARLHLIDTLRAAAPWQTLRRRERPDASANPLVHVRREDFHISRFRQHRETTTLFVVDASGSAALNRMAEAKGAVELLLADCYVRRDKVALMAFRGTQGAELLLAPTRSLVRAKRCLAALPAGGGTPLAAAMDAARQLVEDIARRGGTPLAVFLTDGRANIARDGSPGRERAAADALASAALWRASGAGALWLDTSSQPQTQAQHLALAMGARYLPLPHADAQQMSRAVMALR